MNRELQPLIKTSNNIECRLTINEVPENEVPEIEIPETKKVLIIPSEDVYYCVCCFSLFIIISIIIISIILI